MAECNSCGKEITWIKLRPMMKPHPMNPIPSKVIVLSDLSSDGNPVGKLVDGYVSHFATCPQADEWRNR